MNNTGSNTAFCHLGKLEHTTTRVVGKSFCGNENEDKLFICQIFNNTLTM